MPTPALVAELDALIHRLRPARRPGAVAQFLAPGVAAWTLAEVEPQHRTTVLDCKLLITAAILAIDDRLDDQNLRDDALLGAVVEAGPPPWSAAQTGGWPDDLRATATLWVRAMDLARGLPGAARWWDWLRFDLQGIHRTFSYVRLLQRGERPAAPEAAVILPNDFAMMACLTVDLMACPPLPAGALGPLRAAATWAERVTRLENDLLGQEVEAAQGDRTNAANGFGAHQDRAAEVRLEATAARAALRAAVLEVWGVDGGQLITNLDDLLAAQRQHYAPPAEAPPAHAQAPAAHRPLPAAPARRGACSPAVDAEVRRLDGLFAMHRPWRTPGIVRDLFAPALVGWRLSSVGPAWADAVWVINMQMATAITLFDDRVDRLGSRDPAVLRLALDAGPPPWPGRLLRHLPPDLVAVSALWTTILERAQTLPRWAELAGHLELDRHSLVQAFRFAALIQDGPPPSLREAQVHLAQDYGMVAFAMVDLMASPTVDLAELGALRDALLACQRITRLHNDQLTVQKEAAEGDRTNAMLGFGRHSTADAAAKVNNELDATYVELTRTTSGLRSVDGGRLKRGLAAVLDAHTAYYAHLGAGAAAPSALSDAVLPASPRA